MLFFGTDKCRTCLKEVPDNLILHLKRFDFDLVDMVRRKINGHFPFPMDIDVSAYHVDHLSDPSKPRQEDIFDLVGILVHQGTSEQGHYYSYIRERPYQCGSMTGWVEFNDRDVDVFDDTQIPFSTWGGQFDEFPQQEKLFSAYMLFYQRREAIQRDRREYAGVLQREPAKVPAPQNLRQSIALDNDKVLREYCLHNVEHSKFVRHMLSTLRTVNNGNCSEDHKQEEKCLRIALGHICLILARQKNIEYFEELTNQLRKSLLSCGTCCGIGLKWLATSPAALYVSLFRSPHAKVRSQTGVSLIECLLFLRSQEPLLYYGSDVDTENATGTPGQGVLVDVIQCLRTVYDDSWVSARGWDDLHLTLCQIARIGPIEVAVLLTHGFLEKPLKVFCMHAWEELRGEDPDVWRAVDSAKKSHLARLSRLVELVCLLLSHMDIQLQAESDSFYAFDRLAQYNRSNSRFSLSRHEKTLLTFWDESLKAYAALDKMLEIYDPFKNKVYNALEMMMETYDASKSDIFYPGEILKWMFETGDERMKGKLFRMLREGIVSLDSPWIDPYLRAAINFLEVCPDATCATKIVEQATIKAYAFRDEKEDKSTWEVHLDFLSALVTLQAPALATSGTTADVLCQHILTRVPSYGPTLFLYAKENTRNAMARHLHRLCHVVKSPEYSDDTVRLKYRSIRMLLRDMIQLFINERYAGIAREFLEPLIVSCGMLAKQLSTLHDEGSPLAAYKDQADIALLSRYEEQVETQIMDWHQDDDVPISAGGRVIRRASNASSMTIEATEFALENFETESEELDHLES